MNPPVGFGRAPAYTCIKHSLCSPKGVAIVHNELEYKITKSEIAKFEEALSSLPTDQSDMEPWMVDLQRDAMRSEVEILKAQVAEYETLRGALQRGERIELKLNSLSELPEALIKASIAQGWTQTDLADQLGVKTPQVQNDEATLYQSADFARLQKIAQVLGVEVESGKLLVGR